MKLLVDRLQAGAVYVCVVLGSGDVGVPQEFLHDTQVGSTFQ